MSFNFQIFIFLLDGLGVGAQRDSFQFGDEGANTLGNLIKKIKIDFPNFKKFGLFYFIDGKNKGISSGGKLFQVSRGKDTSSGHWELMGVPLNFSFPTYPEGFPEEIIKEFERKTGRKVIGNKPASGTEIIKELGDEHLKTGALIVYTSADSVFQIAASEDIIPVEELYGYCRIAREILIKPHNVLRVIARPFKKIGGNYIRTEKRKDFSLKPPEKTFLSLLQEKGGKVLGIGKIIDIFASEGIDENWYYKDLREGLSLFKKSMERDFNLIFCNLVDFDTKYGHRRDLEGFASALKEVDDFLPEILRNLKENQIFVLTADHGCDPTYKGTDHTREYVPCLFYGKGIVEGKIFPEGPQSFLAYTLSFILNLNLYNKKGWGEEILKNQ